MRPVPLLLAALLLLGAGAPAWADPTADDFINALDPKAVAQPFGATRGIHANAPRARAGREPALVAGSGEASAEVEFVSGSATLMPAAMRLLNTLGHALSNPRLATYHFRIEGHTDTVGTDAANQALSEQRAAAVAAYLEQKFGLDAARLEAVGLGKQGLAVPTPDQTPEPHNRRVHIVTLTS